MIRSNIRRRKSQKSQINGVPTYSGGSFGGGSSLPDLTTLQYVPYNVDDTVNWLIPDRKIKSDLGFVGNFEGTLNERNDYYNPSNCNSLLTPWRASTMTANYYNINGHQCIGGSVTNLDFGSADQVLTLFSKGNPRTWVAGVVYDIYHTGNINRSDISLDCRDLRASGNVTGKTAVFSGDIIAKAPMAVVFTAND